MQDTKYLFVFANNGEVLNRMAEGKKAFSLYIDLIKLVNGSNEHNVEIEPMTDEETGQLFRWILEYVNDLHPSVPKNIKFAVVQVKKQLDEDLERWKDKCRKNTENINKRWNMERNKSIRTNTNVYESIPTDTKNTDKDKDKDKDISVSKDTYNIQDTNVSSVEVKEIILELPTIQSAKGNKYPIYQEDIDKYQAVYLGVNVLTELKKMLLWLDANPKSRKTYNGIPRFINSWLSREQDKASRNNKNTTPKEEVYRPYRGDNDF